MRLATVGKAGLVAEIRTFCVEWTVLVSTNTELLYFTPNTERVVRTCFACSET
jgi:hypothetical protein